MTEKSRLHAGWTPLSFQQGLHQVRIVRTALAETGLWRVVPHVHVGRSDCYGVTLWGAHSDDGTWNGGRPCSCFENGIFPLSDSERRLFYRAFCLAGSRAAVESPWSEWEEKRLFQWIWPEEDAA